MPAGKDSIYAPELLKRIAFSQRAVSYVVLGDVLRALERLGQEDQLHVLSMATTVIESGGK